MEYLTVKETARLLRVSPITIRRYIASGRLPAERVGRGIRVRRETIKNFLTPVVSQSGSREPSKWSRKPANCADEDLVEIYSPSDPGGVLWVPVERLDEYLDERMVGENNPAWSIVGFVASEDSTEFATNEDEDKDELRTMREVLGISIGIGRSGEPTNIAEHKDEYLADAFEAKG